MKCSIITTILGFFLFVSSTWAVPTPSTTWAAAGTCKVANARSHPEAENAIPDNTTWLSGEIVSYPANGMPGTIEAWADNSDVEYTCDWQPTNGATPPFSEWVWVTWPKNVTYSDYQFQTSWGLVFTPYHDPTGSGGSGTPTASSGPSCKGAPLTSAQINTIYSRGCLYKSYEDDESGFTVWDGDSCLIFFGVYETNYAGQNCIDVNHTTDYLLCPDGHLTTGSSCEGGI